MHKKKRKVNIKFLFLLFFISTLFFYGINIYIKNKVHKDMKDNPKVSVIVPVYNVVDYLQESLDSVVNQSLKEIEIICINDGSTDDSLSILEKYGNKDPRIKVINQPNKGVSNARNNGIMLANGEYVSFLDPDDYFEKNALETAYREAKKNDSDILMFGFNAFPETNAWLERAGRTVDEKYSQSGIDVYLDHDATNYLWNKIYKKSLILEKNIKFCEELDLGEDECFNMLIFSHAKKISSIKEKLYNYRTCREGSLSWGTSKEKIISNRLKLIKEVCSNWDRLNLFNGHEEKMLRYFINVSFQDIIDFDDNSYALSFLKTLNPKIYNQTIIDASLDETKDKLKKIEQMALET